MDRLHHIAITVTDIDRAVTWYMNRFEAEKIYADKSWAMLALDNIAIALVLPNQHPPHIAIEREDAEAFGALTQHRDGTASLYVEDPWGNAIEIMKATQ